MGYDTLFEGEFTLDRPLTPEHKSILDELAETEHTIGEEGKPAVTCATTANGADTRWNRDCVGLW